MKKSLYFIISLLIFLPVMASAHVKWFVENGAHNEVPKEDLIPFSLIAVFMSAVVILLSILLENHLPDLPKNIQYWLNSKKHKVASIFSIIMGVFLLLSAYQGFLFSPDMANLGFLKSPLLIIEILLGMAFLIGFRVRIASISLLVLYYILIFYVGPIKIIESIIIAGSAIFMMIYGRSHYSVSKQKTFANRFFATQEEYALPLLRVIAGLDLFILGFSEKILRPDLALNFLQHHPWNFMQMFGIDWYSDLMFIYSAGIVESLFGLIFILGIITRINALAIGIFFSITLVLLGPVEILGHIPYFAFVALMLLFGSGEKLKIKKF